jgi:hypothetical protein
MQVSNQLQRAWNAVTSKPGQELPAIDGKLFRGPAGVA